MSTLNLRMYEIYINRLEAALCYNIEDGTN